MDRIQTKPLCASSSILADMLTMVNPFDFGGPSSKVKVTMCIIDKCGVGRDATLCVVIFFPTNSSFVLGVKSSLGAKLLARTLILCHHVILMHASYKKIFSFT